MTWMQQQREKLLLIGFSVQSNNVNCYKNILLVLFVMFVSTIFIKKISMNVFFII